MLSNTSKYAIRAVIFIALYSSPGKKVGIKTISEELDMPSPFLGKILQLLARQKILNSTKGPHGGFNLGKPAMDISLIEIVEIMDGADAFDQCMIRTSACNPDAPCSLHDKITTYRKGIRSLMHTETIADLVSEFKNDNERIKI